MVHCEINPPARPAQEVAELRAQAAAAQGPKDDPAPLPKPPVRSPLGLARLQVG